MANQSTSQRSGTFSRRSFLKHASLTAAGLLTGCVPAPVRPANVYFPSGTWQTSTPEEQGIDSRGIANMLDEITESYPYVHSFLLIRNGFLVTEAYFAPAARGLGHFLFSATKSVTSALIGIAIQEKLIKGVDQKILDFFPEMKAKSTSGYLEKLTVEHLLTMSTGHVDFMSPSPYTEQPVDWVEKFLADKTNTLIDPPGETFLYTSGAAHTLSAVIQRVTGRTTAEYAAEKLFGPLEIKEFTWLPDQNGISFGNSWLRLKPEDMARFGYLYLNNGLWNGTQVVPKAWVEKSTKKHIETGQAMFNSAEKDGYGYMWWMNGFGGYSAHGYGGQFIFVLPEYNAVAVFTCGFDELLFDTGYRLMQKHVLPALQSAEGSTKNDAAFQALSDRIAQAGSPTGKTTAPLPATARRISGKAYQFEDGTLFTVSFDHPDTYHLNIVYPVGSGAGVIVDFTGGLDGSFRLNKSFDQVLGESIVAVKGSWLDDLTFVQEEVLTDNITRRILKLHYQEDHLLIVVKEVISDRSNYEVSLEATCVK